MKVEIDETKNKVLIRRIANDIRLKPYFERNVTYKEIDERIKENVIETMCFFILIGSLLACYLLVLVYVSLLVGRTTINKDELNIMLLLLIIMLFGIELGLATFYNVIKTFVRKDFREADDLEIINLNK